jgi:hypothetical protein
MYIKGVGDRKAVKGVGVEVENEPFWSLAVECVRQDNTLGQLTK